MIQNSGHREYLTLLNITRLMDLAIDWTSSDLSVGAFLRYRCQQSLQVNIKRGSR